MTLELDWLAKWNMYSPQAVALKDGDFGQEYTYQQFFQNANRAAFLLKNNYGVKAGDRVAILATNELEFVFLFYGCQRLGAILVPINFRLTAREVQHIVGDSTPKVLFFQKEFFDLVSDLDVEHKVVFSGAESFSSVLHKTAFCEIPFAANFEDPCMIIYTSGTTGSPKGALLSQKMLFWNSINTTMRLNICEDDCAVIFLPFFHTGGWNVLTTPFIHRGAKLVFLRKFDGDKILRLSADEKATLLFGVPTTMDMMARSPIFKDIDLSKLRYAIVGGEPMPIELIKIWHDKGVPVRQGYGLTEFGPNVFSLNEQDALRKIGSIGFPNFYIETKVVNDLGDTLGADEIGELVLRGPSCMMGYWNQPQATAETIVDGWLHTGDLVRRDTEGYYYVVGRKKDMFKSGGENVYPVELEQVLRAHPGVREAAVIGVPDDKWGEVGRAFIVSEKPELSLEEIQAYCVKNLAKFKIPKYFQFLDSLPKGDSGKILKKSLKEMQRLDS